GLEPLERRRGFPAAAGAQHRERARDVPSPAQPEHRRREERLNERLFGLTAVEEPKHLLQRKAVLRAKRERNAVVVGGSLEFEIERAAEALAHRQPPRAVDADAVGRVDHELHAARLVEETLKENFALRGD